MCKRPAGHSFLFSINYCNSPLPAAALTAKVLMHTLPRSVILRASAQVLCCWHFVNLSPGQRQFEQSGCSGLMERQSKLCSRVTLCWLSIHHSGVLFKGLGMHRDKQTNNWYWSRTLQTLCFIAIITRPSRFLLLDKCSCFSHLQMLWDWGAQSKQSKLLACFLLHSSHSWVESKTNCIISEMNCLIGLIGQKCDLWLYCDVKKAEIEIQVVCLRQQLVKLRWVLNPLRSLDVSSPPLLHAQLLFIANIPTISSASREGQKNGTTFFFSFILMCRIIIYRALLDYSHNHTDQQQGGWERLVTCTPQLEKKIKKKAKNYPVGTHTAGSAPHLHQLVLRMILLACSDQTTPCHISTVKAEESPKERKRDAIKAWKR